MAISDPNYNPEAEQMFSNADKKINEGNVQEAHQMLIALTDKFPEFGKAYNHLGYIYETKYRDAAMADAYYKYALKYAPNYPATYMNYAVVLSTSERFSELEELLNKALTVPGMNKDRIYNEFGIMKELQGLYDDAMAYYRKAITYSFVEKDIELYDKSINRCNIKKKY